MSSLLRADAVALLARAEALPTRFIGSGRVLRGDQVGLNAPGGATFMPPRPSGSAKSRTVGDATATVYNGSTATNSPVPDGSTVRSKR